MMLKTILKLMAKKYPAGENKKGGWLGAMLILYDDGGGYIRHSRRAGDEEEDTRDYMRNRLFSFGTLDELIEHLKEN